MDNYFSSPALFHDLATNQVKACGTLRTVRQGVPNSVKQSTLKAGEPPFTDRDGPMLFLVWFDKRIVSPMTTAQLKNIQKVSEIKTPSKQCEVGSMKMTNQ